MNREKELTKLEGIFLMSDKGQVYEKVMRKTEKDLIEKALERSFGNQSIAAKILGINRNTLRMKVRKMDIDVKSFKL